MQLLDINSLDNFSNIPFSKFYFLSLSVLQFRK